MTNDDHSSSRAFQENNTKSNTASIPLKPSLTSGGFSDPYSAASSENVVPYPSSILRSNMQTSDNIVTKAPKKKKATPTIGSLGKEGKIMCRTSLFTILLRRWTDSHWVHVHPTTILVFKTKESMEEWKILHRAGEGADNNSNKSNKLIQWSIDFDTSGVVYKRMVKAEKKKCKLMNIPPPKSRTKVDDSYNYIPPVTYAMEEVRSKYYNGRTAPLLHTCKISYLSSSGRTIAAVFGSTDSPDLKQLRATIRYCIKLVFKYTSKKRKQSNAPIQGNGDNDNTVYSGSTMGGTQVSGAGYSHVASEFSNTVYGRNTMTPSTLNWVEANE